MPKLDNWSWNGKSLQGIISNSPLHKAGKFVTTSSVVGINGKLIETRSGTLYKLGTVDPNYEALYPNARERMFKSIRERTVK